jgi:putrescine aminotransferase
MFTGIVTDVGRVRAIRDTIVFCPPLVISHAQIDRLVDTIARALDEAEPTLRALSSVGPD